MDMIKERCIYCGSDVYYSGTETLIKCGMCGHTLVVAKFENELVRMNQAIEEGETAKKKLKDAEKARDHAKARLEKAMDALEGIHISQRSVDKALSRIANDFSKNKEEQKEMKKLLIAIRGRVNTDGDMISHLFEMVSQSQQAGDQKFDTLQMLADTLLKNQNNMLAAMAVLPQLSEKLNMSVQQQNQLAGSFMTWFQNIRQEDVKRLKAISESTRALNDRQKLFEEKIALLHQAAVKTQSKIDGLHREYSRDKLEKLQNLYHQAEDYQNDRRYDKAEDYYHKVLTEGGEDAEVYWRLIMCHYCLFYEKNEEGKMIPIILNPDLSDPAEMSLRKRLYIKMSEQGKQIYTVKLQEIDRILDKYRLLKDEMQYDVFISVKQKDGTHYTDDSDVASDLYDFLSGHGLRVFNSRRTPIPLGGEYEPYIIAALISSKAMIVVGTTPENMNSKWVKNEWSRFQWLQFREKEKSGKTDRILFCYLAKGMKAEQIPLALHPDRQAVYDGVKAQSSLLAGLSFLKKTNSQTERFGYVTETKPGPDFRNIKNQMTFWLVRGQFDKVLEKYEQLTEDGLFLTYASLHMAALCAVGRVSDISLIVNSDFVLEDAPEYKAAVLLCEDEEEKKELEDILAQNKRWRNAQEVQINEVEKKTEEKTEIKVEQAASKQNEAEDWYNKAKKANSIEEMIQYYKHAAELGHVDAQRDLAFSYRYTAGENHSKMAVFWYQKAAEQGDIFSQRTLGHFYELGKYVEQDYKQMVYWYEKAAEQGDTFALSQLINFVYGSDRYSLKDLGKRFYWCQKAAELGDNEAQRRLGDFYYQGEGVEKDLEQAFNWYLKSAEQGNSYAQRELGYFYSCGVGVGTNWKQAINWYRKSAEQGNSEAQEILGDCYYSGKGVKKDMKQAFNWYLKSAEQGDSRAQINVGQCYYTGVGVAKNLEQALYWYQKAAEKGDKIAIKTVENIKNKLKENEQKTRTTS